MLYLSVSSDTAFPQPVIRFAIGTLSRRMDALDPKTVFRNLEGFLIGVVVIPSRDKTGPASPDRPGRIGHRRKEAVVTTDIRYDERKLPKDAGNPDRLLLFADRIGLAIAALSAWCDRKDAWADRPCFDTAWAETEAAIRRGAFLRPYEFALTPAERDRLDDDWETAWKAGLSTATFDTAIRRYLDTRDRAWAGAQYQPDPSRAPGRFGQPTLVANHAANIATARPPDARTGFTIY